MTLQPFVSDSDFTLYVGDVRDVFAGLPDGSIDCVVTSPPYWGLRDYGSEGQIGLEPTPELYVEQIVAVFRQVKRVMADHATLWLNLGDSYANKQRQMMPARVALALQSDGWWLRSEIVWFKLNPMPASVTDRPTDAHEMVYLLSKQPRYFFDQEAVREPHAPDGRNVSTRTVGNGSHGNYQEFGHEEGRERWPNSGRNVRSVWEIATQPYPEAHFATFPEALAERCIRAGCPEWVCGTCGKARERLVESEIVGTPRNENGNYANNDGTDGTNSYLSRTAVHRTRVTTTTGWSDCGHDNYRPGRVLDPFMGSGTVALVARNQRRHSIGVELNEEYARLCAKRLQQLSLLAEGTM